MLEEEQFLGFLRSRGLRATAERRALIREIFAQHGHFDADSILAAVHRRGLAISRATVYRNLELLVQAGLAHKVRLSGRSYLYEHLHSGQRHDHMACRCCGRMVEFVSPGITALLGEICRAHGFEGRQNQLADSRRLPLLRRGESPGRRTRANRRSRERTSMSDFNGKIPGTVARPAATRRPAGGQRRPALLPRSSRKARPVCWRRWE